MNSDRIVNTIQQILGFLGIEASSIHAHAAGGSTFFSITTTESGKLIGTRGETLSALNHIVKKILEKEVAQNEHFSIDVNGYHLRRITALEEQARLAANRALTFQYDVELAPMNAYERMVVHNALKDIAGVQTTSYGEGPLRHVIIRCVTAEGVEPHREA